MKHRWPYLVAAIISGTLMIWAAIWGYAALITVKARENITHWEEIGKIDNTLAASQAWDRLTTAQSLNSGNAEFHMDLARLALLQASAPEQDQTDFHTQVITHLKLALSKRPSWGLAWAKLAQAYATDPELSSEFIQALERAIYFEPYEKRSQQLIIPLAIAQWEILSPPMQEQSSVIILHALRYQSSIIHLTVSTAIKYGWEDKLAPLLTRKWHKNVLSKAIRKKSGNR